jgi:hypothetical protein
MPSLRLSRQTATYLTLAAALLLVGVTAEKHASSIAAMSVPEIEEKLQVRTGMGFAGIHTCPLYLT